LANADTLPDRYCPKLILRLRLLWWFFSLKKPKCLCKIFTARTATANSNNFSALNMSKGLLIKGGKVVNADRTFNGDIYCENGVIKRIAPSIDQESVAADVRVIDAHGKIIVPGKHCRSSLELTFLLSNHFYCLSKKLRKITLFYYRQYNHYFFDLIIN
jgi:hypothetical protein